MYNKLCGKPPQYAPAPCKLTFDLLTLKVFLGFSVLDLGPMYVTDRQTDRQTDVKRASLLKAPTLGAEWCSGNALILINAVAHTLSSVSTGMGDCLRAGKLSHYVTSHPGQLSLAIPPWVGAMSTGDGNGHCWGRKRRVLRSSSPCDQDCWYIDLVG